MKKLLIANRAEIARRITRTCSRLGIETVSICSEIDKDSLFAREAKNLVVMLGISPREAYLDIEKIIKVAKEQGCDAIHPGYGFLSENPEFAKNTIEAGLVFVGPKPKTIELLGHKTKAKEVAKKAGVPCLESSPSGLLDKELKDWAGRFGFPLLIKAVAGGGGRGMRVVLSSNELEELLPRARGEAKKNFNNDDIFLERYLEKPRHIEVQIMGDSLGNLIHLGTRDCSIQRRHQKLLEEAPASNLTKDLREGLHQAAVKLGKAVGYENAGTVEFLVKDKNFYFLEVNTRIQVEHPVTEEITGLDLIELQLNIAQGKPLPLKQEEVEFNGHAIEFRICAEDLENNFRPGGGRLSIVRKPSLSSMREDFGFEKGDEISLHYDSLLSKVIVKGGTRREAIQKSIDVLSSYEISGPINTLALGQWLLYNGTFREGALDIGFLEREFTRDSLKWIKALNIRDPLWESPKTRGIEVENQYKYTSERYKTTYTIDILHKKDGFFVAVPTDGKGKRGKNMHCRMSNGFNEAMQSLIDDVLEKNPPSEIF